MTTPLRGSRYVAIGSSFAAGPGLIPTGPDRPTKARQSARNYPHLVAEGLGFDLVDVTSSGATVEPILRLSQCGQPPQIAVVTEDVELLSVTVGGNDIGYLPSMIAASLPAWFTKMPVLGPRLRRAAAAARAGDRLTRTAGSVGQVLTAIRDRAPSARIICVDYLTVLPPDYRGDLPFNEPAHRALTGLVDDLNGALALACSELDVQLLPAADHSIAHHAWSAEPWTSGRVRPRRGGEAAFHPTPAVWPPSPISSSTESRPSRDSNSSGGPLGRGKRCRSFPSAPGGHFRHETRFAQASSAVTKPAPPEHGSDGGGCVRELGSGV